MVESAALAEPKDDGLTGGRCIVLGRPGGNIPADLLSALGARGLVVEVVLAAPDAMVELAAGPVVALIVVEPQFQPRIDELVAAVHRNFPHTVCWQCVLRNGDERPKLDRLNGHAGADFTSPLEPQQRSSGKQDNAQDSQPKDESDAHSETTVDPLISDEELDMLLRPLSSQEVGTWRDDRANST